MMNTKSYQVLEEYVDSPDVKPNIANILKTLKTGDIIQAKDLTSFVDNVKEKTKYQIASVAIRHAEKIGIITNTKCTIDEFEKFETVSYWMDQLKQYQVRNIKKEKKAGTQYAYVSHACAFHNWLTGQEFTFKNTIQTGTNTFETQETVTILEGLEHLLKLFQNSYNSESHFIKIIKKYLMSSNHEGKKASTVTLVMSAIKSYFSKNESPISFSFDPDSKYDNTKGSMEDTSLSLEEIFMMLTIGKPNIMERALFLCKFHRGLDNSTFADSFNYDAWEQLVDYFGTEEYQKWNVKKCPVPIKLLRVKTQFIHTGFLDVDAIESLKVYLKYRYELTGKPMTSDEPLFITSKKFPVTGKHVYRIFRTLMKNSGLQEKLKGYKVTTRFKRNSHECRDTLKSTLIASGCRIDIADHIIGHKHKDSYEKQTTLFSKQLREEFHKASKTLNMFSNMSENIQGNVSENEVEDLRQQVLELSDRFDRVQNADDKNDLKLSKTDLIRNAKTILREYAPKSLTDV